MKTVEARATFVLVATVTIAEAGMVLAYFISGGDPQLLYMVPTTVAATSVVMWLISKVLKWIYSPKQDQPPHG